MRSQNPESRTSTYSANSLNQYTQRTVPGAFDVIGTAKSDATVTVNNQPTSRTEEYFHGTAVFDNSSSPVLNEIHVVGVKNHVGTDDEDAVSEKTGHVFLPQTPEAFTYDFDGNLLSDGRWNYTWDGENRLVKMETRPDVAQPPSAVVRQKLEFTYDYQGRRVSKKVYGWDSGSSSYQLLATSTFVYDGWNLLAELDGSGNLIRSYTWGTDLSGSFQGAGGVGGLLFSTQYSVPRTQCFSYDGNGNVVALVDVADGTISGEYDYSPFGETLRVEGTAAEENLFRFSSKYSDLETGLVYYGFRYYNPSSGRWMSRDPIEERGGNNLYIALLNDAVNKIDSLGLNPAFQQRVDRIELYLDFGDTSAAAQEAYFLYVNLTTGGQFVSPLANEMMEHWLDNTGTKKTFNASQVKGLVKDEEISKQFGTSMTSLKGTGTTSHATNVTPTLNTDYYYALGKFQLSFHGDYCVQGDQISLDGEWSIKDRYDWHQGFTVTVQGVVIKDDYALLVEGAGRAKPFDVDGEWEGKHTVSKTGLVGRSPR